MHMVKLLPIRDAFANDEISIFYVIAEVASMFRDLEAGWNFINVWGSLDSSALLGGGTFPKNKKLKRATVLLCTATVILGLTFPIAAIATGALAVAVLSIILVNDNAKTASVSEAGFGSSVPRGGGKRVPKKSATKSNRKKA